MAIGAVFYIEDVETTFHAASFFSVFEKHAATTKYFERVVVTPIAAI